MMKMLRVLALPLALLLALGACGDESNEPTGQVEATQQADDAEADAEASNEEFCAAVVQAETAILAAQSGGDTSELEALMATVEETAPEELTEQVAVVVAAVRQALESQDDSAFGTDDFATNEEEVDQWVADNCGFEEIDISAVDYAFEGVPETIPAGIVTFNFSNDGEEVHEMLMVRYKDESLTIDDLMKLSDKEAQKKLVFLGASFGPPGAEDSESKELEPGKYALLCFVPVGSTSEEEADKAKGPPHVARGMSAEFVVE